MQFFRRRHIERELPQRDAGGPSSCSAKMSDPPPDLHSVKIEPPDSPRVGMRRERDINDDGSDTYSQSDAGETSSLLSSTGISLQSANKKSRTGSMKDSTRDGSSTQGTEDSDFVTLDWDPVVAQMLYLFILPKHTYTCYFRKFY